MRTHRQAILQTPTSALVAGLVLGAGVVIGANAAAGPSLPSTSAAPVLYDEGKVVELYQTASPAAVEIAVRGANRTARSFQTGQGSGFLVDAEGFILTNYHVVEGAAGIQVNFHNGKSAAAQVVSTSPSDDLALLRVDVEAVEGVTPLPLGDSDLVRPGQMAIALGSPFGLENSITVGVISGANRTIRSVTSRPITGALQTDASINPGNSGGPLLNSSGQVIGINTAIEASSSGASTGVGFAVSANTAKRFLAAARSGASSAISIRPWLGITGTPVTPALARSYGLSVERGVYLLAIAPGSPAARAGLAGGAVISAVDGKTLTTMEDLVAELGKRRPGDTVSLDIVKDGKASGVSVTLAEWPSS